MGTYFHEIAKEKCLLASFLILNGLLGLSWQRQIVKTIFWFVQLKYDICNLMRTSNQSRVFLDDDVCQARELLFLRHKLVSVLRRQSFGEIYALHFHEVIMKFRYRLKIIRHCITVLSYLFVVYFLSGFFTLLGLFNLKADNSILIICYMSLTQIVSLPVLYKSLEGTVYLMSLNRKLLIIFLVLNALFVLGVFCSLVTFWTTFKETLWTLNPVHQILSHIYLFEAGVAEFVVASIFYQSDDDHPKLLPEEVITDAPPNSYLSGQPLPTPVSRPVAILPSREERFGNLSTFKRTKGTGPQSSLTDTESPFSSRSLTPVRPRRKKKRQVSEPLTTAPPPSVVSASSSISEVKSSDKEVSRGEEQVDSKTRKKKKARRRLKNNPKSVEDQLANKEPGSKIVNLASGSV